jgi:[protein-PII] uridylyltransferase
VSGGVIQRGGKHRVGAAETAFRAAAAKAGGIDAEAFIAQQYPEYWLKTEVGKQIDHARMVAQAKAGGETLVTHVTTDGFRGVTELSILAPDHARLLALFAGACAAADANIVGAYVSTTRDGFALDTFLLQRSFDDDEDEMRRAKRIGSTIRKVLGGEARLATLLAKRQESKPVTTTFRVPPEVVIDNALSEALTVIEVAGLDRPGLLYDLTTAISDLNLNIASAHVTTFGEKAVDVFYVADLTGKKISSPAREKTIRERLVAALTPPAG